MAQLVHQATSALNARLSVMLLQHVEVVVHATQTASVFARQTLQEQIVMVCRFAVWFPVLAIVIDLVLRCPHSLRIWLFWCSMSIFL